MTASPPGGVGGRGLLGFLRNRFLEDPTVRELAKLAGTSLLPEYRNGVGSYCAMLGFIYGDGTVYVMKHAPQRVYVLW